MRKKIVLALMLVCFLGTSAFAGTAEMKKAFKEKDYVLAISEADKVLADGDASIPEKVNAQLCKGLSYLEQANYAVAITEFQKAIAIEGYSAKSMLWIQAKAQHLIGVSLYRKKEYNESITACQKGIDNYPQEKNYCSCNLLEIGYCYERLGLPDKARETFVRVCLEYPDTASLAVLKMAFANVSQVEVGNEKYAEVLMSLDTMDNNAATAKFLGVIESQMEKKSLQKYLK